MRPAGVSGSCKLAAVLGVGELEDLYVLETERDQGFFGDEGCGLVQPSKQ